MKKIVPKIINVLIVMDGKKKITTILNLNNFFAKMEKFVRENRYVH